MQFCYTDRTIQETEYVRLLKFFLETSAVTPEQTGMCVYPYVDEEEHVIYNTVNDLLLHPYVSSQVWWLSEKSLSLMKEGIKVYKAIRKEL